MERSKIYALLVVSFGLQTCIMQAGDNRTSRVPALAPLGLLGSALSFFTESRHPYALCLRRLVNRARGVKAPSDLHRAANLGDLALVRRCIEYGMDVNTPDGDGLRPLYLAAFGGHKEVARLLLDRGAKSHVTNCSFEALYREERGGPAGVVCRLPSSAPMVRETALHVASRHGHEAVVRLLLESEWNVNVVDGNHESPLHMAIRNRHEEVVRLLIAARANVNYANENLWWASVPSPLFLAAEIGFVPAVQELLRGGAGVDWKRGGGMTPLLKAASSGHVEVVRLMLQAGANVNALDNCKQTALILAVKGGHIEVAQELLTAESVGIDSADSSGLTALHWSLDIDGGLEIVRALIDAGASVNCVIKPISGIFYNSNNFHRIDGDTPLHVAVVRSNDAAVRLLLDRQAQTSATNSQGKTPLLLAAEAGHASIVRMLLRAEPAMMKVTDKDQNTPWICALLEGHLPVVQLFLEHGADITAPLTDGYTPLQYAVSSESSALVRFLLLNGADVHAVMNDRSMNPGSIHEVLGWLNSEYEVDEEEYANGNLDGVIKELVARGAKLTQQTKDWLKSGRGQQFLEECENLAEARLKSVKQWLQQAEEGCLPQDLVHRCAEIMLPSSQVAQLKHLRSTSQGALITQAVCDDQVSDVHCRPVL